jgi:2-oxoglutarate ferredoxin oxidoreductase subunit beta
VSTYLDYLDESALPLIWCPGCGDGTILKALLGAFATMGLARENTVVVTGIGCWGKADDYIRTNAIHGTHGRALAVATGVKAFRPDLTVVALMGDGDCATIGGNHFIHAARRNIGVTAIVANNYNYGMTGGQFSGTTPAGSRTTTSPFGHTENAFDLCRLADAAGANFVARTTAYHFGQMGRLMVEALREPGFSLVEVVSPCPTYYGRFNKQGSASEMWRSLKERARSVGAGGVAAPAEAGALEVPLDDGPDAPILTGRLVNRHRPSFAERYAAVQAKAAGMGEGAELDAR